MFDTLEHAHCTRLSVSAMIHKVIDVCHMVILNVRFYVINSDLKIPVCLEVETAVRTRIYAATVLFTIATASLLINNVKSK
jgi:hypothetical protein